MIVAKTVLLAIMFVTFALCQNTTKTHYEQIILHAETYYNMPSNYIWRYRQVSVKNPFIFLHQRKTGGSSIRVSLYNAAKVLNHSRYVAGFGGIHDATFKIPDEEYFAIHGMHINWYDAVERLSLQTVTNNSQFTINEDGSLDSSSDNSELPFSCLTGFRNPINRLRSCVYYRFKEYLVKHNYSCINDMPITEFAVLLAKGRDAYGNSCINEPFRIFSNVTKEFTLAHLGNAPKKFDGYLRIDYGEHEVEVMETTLKNLAHCVPFILEYPESRDLLRHSFPELYAQHAFDPTVHIRVVNEYTNCLPPDEDHLSVMRIFTAYEQILYDTVVSKVRRALLDLGL